jgi:hypothetical protein
MSVSLNKIPRWALVSALSVTLPVAGWALNSTVGQIGRNTSDIKRLAEVTAQLAEATANLKDVQKAQTEDQRMIRQETNDLLKMLYQQTHNRRASR